MKQLGEYIRSAYRATVLALLAFYGLLVTSSLSLLRMVSRKHHARLLQAFARHWFRLVRVTFRVHAEHVGEPAFGKVLYAANHVSWLDIVVLGEQIGARFISKSEVAAWPLVGWLARGGGTLFVERGQHDSAALLLDQMTWRLKREESILFFPEGTTTDGSHVRRFKPRLFVAGVRVSANVQPVTLCYRKEHGESDPVAFVETVTFVRSVLGVMGKRKSVVTVYWDTPFVADSSEAREVAARAEQFVRSRFADHFDQQERDGQVQKVRDAE